MYQTPLFYATPPGDKGNPATGAGFGGWLRGHCTQRLSGQTTSRPPNQKRTRARHTGPRFKEKHADSRLALGEQLLLRHQDSHKLVPLYNTQRF